MKLRLGFKAVEVQDVEYNLSFGASNKRKPDIAYSVQTQVVYMCE